MPSRGNNGYIGGVEPRDSAGVAKAVFNSREHAYAYSSGDLGESDYYNYTDSSYVRPSSGGGSGATATVSLKNGEISGFRITNGGSGYTTVPTVTFTGGGGTGAEAVATRNASNVITAVDPWYQLYAVDIIYGGEGYTSAPTITISAPQGAGGTTATVTSTTITNGVLTGITFGTTGTRYTGQPTFTISTSGSTYPAQVAAKLRCGSGYTSAPTIGFSGGGGTNAAATAYIKAELDTVTITANGSGYTTAPTVYIPGMNLSATATATVSGGQVTAISISGCTNLFYDPPSVIIGGWPELPSVSNGDQKLVGAVAIYNNNSNFLALTCSGNYTVNWGDGTSNNYNSNVTAYKQYTTTEYAAISGQSEYLGYKVVIVTITPQAGQNLTTISLGVKHNQSGLSNTVNAWLDVKVAGQNLTNLTLGSSATAKLTLLEQFEFVGTNTGLTSFGSMFLNCINLRNIIALPPSAVTSLDQAFYGCRSLRYIPDFTTSAITSLNNAFALCSALIRIPVITSTSITNFNSAFQGCSAIKYIPVKITSAATTANLTFASCSALIRLPPIDASNITSMSSTFAGCRNIQEVPDLDLRKCAQTGGLFSNCTRVRYIGHLNTSAATSGSAMFQNCIALQEVASLQTAKMTNLSYLFDGCISLIKAPVIDVRSSTSNFYMFQNCQSLVKPPTFINSGLQSLSQGWGMFQYCSALEEFPYFDYGRTTDVGSTFWACSSLINIPQLNVSRVTSMSYLFYQTYALARIPKIICPSATTVAYMFNQSTVKWIENITLGSVTSADGLFGSCEALLNMPVVDLTSMASAAQAFATDTNIRSGYTTGMKYGHSYQNADLAAAELDTIYTNLGTAVGAQTITVTGNWGTATDTTSIATNKGWTVSG